MAERDAPDQQQSLDLQEVAEEAFSSEKREDIWALIIAMAILLFSVAFPEQIRHFFSSTLYLF
ncbi:MAG: hypothetical protein F4053_10735 [Proteobacteria bacterium]|nr:hypothetical protein [Pseudomonadota bacterium]